MLELTFPTKPSQSWLYPLGMFNPNDAMYCLNIGSNLAIDLIASQTLPCRGSSVVPTPKFGKL